MLQRYIFQAIQVISCSITSYNFLKATKRREEEQEEPGGTQTAAMMAAYGGADRGKSHGGGRADGGGAGGRGAQGGDGEPTIQGDGWIRRAKAEQTQATEAQAGIQKATVEPEGGRSPTEPEGWRDEAKPEV